MRTWRRGGREVSSAWGGGVRGRDRVRARLMLRVSVKIRVSIRLRVSVKIRDHAAFFA